MTLSPNGKSLQWIFFLWQIVSTFRSISFHPAAFPYHFSKLKLFSFCMPHLLHPPIKLGAPQNTQPAVLPEHSVSPYPDFVLDTQLLFPVLKKFTAPLVFLKNNIYYMWLKFIVISF